jgi:hypothetical protein
LRNADRWLIIAAKVSRYYHHHRQSHYRTELVFPVAMVAVLLIALLVAGISWVLPDNFGEASAQEAPAQPEKPSRISKFLHGVVRAAREAVQDDEPPHD